MVFTIKRHVVGFARTKGIKNENADQKMRYDLYQVLKNKSSDMYISDSLRVIIF